MNVLQPHHDLKINTDYANACIQSPAIPKGMRLWLGKNQENIISILYVGLRTTKADFANPITMLQPYKDFVEEVKNTVEAIKFLIKNHIIKVS